ncbi:MAG TPA: type I polyketide synthase, partial [Thermoanaerobaculia bacterium]|nr:type I polyketide synthase [Thermoanaerobaculia bacterium]
KTLFYEHETIRELTSYLVREAGAALSAKFGGGGEAGGEPAAASLSIEEDSGLVAAADVFVADEESDELEAIAIIGMHGSYPQSETLDRYWENLKAGRDLVGLVPSNRWDWEATYDPRPEAAAEGKIYCKWGAFLDHHDRFDPQFFKISTAEAKWMDPQERLFLESVWAAVEDAGYTRESLKKRYPKGKSADVGVFVGVTTNTYQLWAPEERMRGNYVAPSAMPWSIANRVSYFFNFNGPSLPVDTACSSSLVAIHLACESLRRRECRLAVAGGVNLYLHPAKYESLCQRRMLSVGGKTYSYGAGDDGFVPGEGVGSVVLKPLARAVADGDFIYGVIRGSAYDHSGRSNGYTAPNPVSQRNLISQTLEKAGIPPETIGYVEGHGTGTQLGDSIEIVALSQAFRSRTAKTQFCPIGSVKANIGHSESAAGVASLAKVLLQMKHGQLAPSIHSEEPNPNIEFEQSPFYLQHALTEWPAGSESPRRALINSFGAGGVNACMIVEEYPRVRAVAERRESGPQVFVLSARNEERLQDYVEETVAYLRGNPGVDPAGFCQAFQLGREAMEERLAVVVSGVDELTERLEEWSRRGAAAGVLRGTVEMRRGARRGALSTHAWASMTPQELALKWIAGEDVDWESVCEWKAPRRSGLPTYPFARDRYWVSDAGVPERPAQAGSPLHPLIAANSSTLQEISFSSALSESAFYAVDHKVHDESILPGAAFLEMACIAGNLAGERSVRRIADVVWMQPLSFRDGAQTLRTVLRKKDDGVLYEISSIGDDDEPIVYAEGRLVFDDAPAEGAESDDRVPLDELLARCQKVEDGAACYGRFDEYGLHYGPSFQTIQELYVDGTAALSKLTLADHLKHDFADFILHPSIVDGALQTIAGAVRSIAPSTPYLPFALDEIEILRPVTQNCYAYAERAEMRSAGAAGVMKFNIRLVNEHGEVLVRFRNLYVRPFGRPEESREARTA